MGETAPARDAKPLALREEREHLGRVVDRIEQIRGRARAQVSAASADTGGPTFQARFERDVAVHHHAARAARFTFGDVESLVFGRLDRSDGDVHHIGKVSVIDDDGDVLLVDWRAAAAAPFYRATAARPEGVARRRTLATRGREVRDVADEILDAAAAERLGLQAVTGQGALLAALARERGTSMGDIVASIAADQDAIVRAPARGILIVTGGPGTGKTVVALHRVAYLLYEDRERFERRGVLIVGPSRAFTSYTSTVLPSLGEDSTVQRSLADLATVGAEIDGWDEPDIARIKNDIAMVEFARRALLSSLPPLPADTRISVDGVSVHLAGRRVSALRASHLARLRADGPTYRGQFERARSALFSYTWKQWHARALDAGQRPGDDPRDHEFDAHLAAAPSMRMLLRSFWPELDPVSVLRDTAAVPGRVEQLCDGLLDERDAQRLAAAWREADGLRVDDTALLDELDALIGPEQQPDETPGQMASTEQLRLESDAFVVQRPRVDPSAAGYRDFAHVVVDEAQDLGPMQWRMLARRGQYASWTLVGDLAQRSVAGDAMSWHEIAQLVGRRQVATHHLDMNYRTPAEIAEVGAAVLASVDGSRATLPRAVRHTGIRPRLISSPSADAVVAATVDERGRDHGGTVAVIAPAGLLAGLVAALENSVVAAQGRCRAIDPRSVKGLEFDDVVVVAPDVIGAEPDVGGRQLYVAVTRATRTLTFIASPGATFPGQDLCEQVAASRPR